MKTGMMCLAALSADVGMAATTGSISLASQGTARACIVLPSKPTAVERTAAQELKTHLEGVTGAEFAICSEDNPLPKKTKLFVGATRAAAQLLPEPRAENQPADAIRIKTTGHHIVLTGHPRRGALYAVFTFLEDVVGVRWWTPTEQHLPAQPDLTIPPLNSDYAPPIIDRSTRYTVFSNGIIAKQSAGERKGHGVTSMAFSTEELRKMGVFAARCRLNGQDTYTIPDAYGGANSLIGWVHTFYSLLPPETYFGEHPDWYSMIDGQRTHRRAQLCLTNDAMRRELVRNALKKLRETPNPTMISVSQNDWGGRCQCPRCKAVEHEEQSPAGPLIHFVNQVAEDIEKAFPDILVETLAYQYTRVPPKHVRPRHNVVIRLCTIECCFAQPLANGSHNQPFRDDIAGWSNIAKQLYIWDYTTNFRNYLVPHPNLQVLGTNIRFFAENKAIGIFEQGDSGCRTGHFVRLKGWLLAHLLWNPNSNEEALIQEFLRGYYGPAAKHLSAYLDCLAKAATKSGVYLNCFRLDTSDWLDLHTMNQAMDHFEAALHAVKDMPRLHERVRRERLPLDHVWLRRYAALRKQAKQQGLPFRGPADPHEALSEFLTLARKHRVGRIRQGQAFPEDLRTELPPFHIPPGPVPETCRQLPHTHWLELQDADYIPRRRPNLFKIVSDPNASNTLARRMPNTHTIWACHSFPLGNYGIKAGEMWNVTISVRAEAGTTAGNAMQIGIYDDRKRESVISRVLPVSAIRGDTYQHMDLGTHSLAPEMYVWAAPVIRTPEQVSAVYVDRVVLTRKE